MDENWRDEYMKPGFEVFKNFENVKPSADVDLDGEIYADQLHSLLQRISTAPGLDELKTNLNRSDNKTKRKMTDDEKILNQIHCLDDKNEFNAQFHVAPKADERQPRMQTPQNGGVFEGFIDGPKYHRQAFSYQLVRRPNGSVLTKTTTDSNGNTKTVIETTVDGERKIQTLVNGVEVIDGAPIASNKWTIDYGRHLYINKDGYALPKNLWWLEIYQSKSEYTVRFGLLFLLCLICSQIIENYISDLDTCNADLMTSHDIHLFALFGSKYIIHIIVSNCKCKTTQLAVNSHIIIVSFLSWNFPNQFYPPIRRYNVIFTGTGSIDS